MLYHAQTWSGTDLKDLQALIFFHLSIFFYPLLLLAFTSYNPDPDPIWKICRHLQFICILCPCFLNYIFFILFFLVPVSLNCISVTRALQKWKKKKENSSLFNRWKKLLVFSSIFVILNWKDIFEEEEYRSTLRIKENMQLCENFP